MYEVQYIAQVFVGLDLLAYLDLLSIIQILLFFIITCRFLILRCVSIHHTRPPASVY